MLLMLWVTFREKESEIARDRRMCLLCIDIISFIRKIKYLFIIFQIKNILITI